MAANINVAAHSADYFYGYTGGDIVFADGATARAELHGGGGNDTLTAGSGGVARSCSARTTTIALSATPASITSSARPTLIPLLMLGLGATDYVYDFTKGTDKADMSALAGFGIHGLGDLAFNGSYGSGGWYGYGYGTGALWVDPGAGQGALAAGDFVFV